MYSSLYRISSLFPYFVVCNASPSFLVKLKSHVVPVKLFFIGSLLFRSLSFPVFISICFPFSEKNEPTGTASPQQPWNSGPKKKYWSSYCSTNTTKTTFRAMIIDDWPRFVLDRRNPASACQRRQATQRMPIELINTRRGPKPGYYVSTSIWNELEDKTAKETGGPSEDSSTKHIITSVLEYVTVRN
ncbi:hypothetical protein CRE_05125 [Caenorhabditis remanei]|uniref:Uncharacterized protein n=1 Tax=Caenorhabditis remanei TaxID=31234 RepID=E3N6C0_CAERE|nr:hypothetical protein CRE_05125 [Caenorhabditis remanei]